MNKRIKINGNVFKLKEIIYKLWLISKNNDKLPTKVIKSWNIKKAMLPIVTPVNSMVILGSVNFKNRPGTCRTSHQGSPSGGTHGGL